MTSSAKNRDALRSIHSADLEAFLAKNGFVLDQRVHEKASFWKRPGSRVLITVPLRPEFADYPERVSDVLVALTRVTGQALNVLMNDLESISHDTLRIREQRHDRSGTTPLTNGTRLISVAENALRHAARFSASRYAPQESRPDWQQYLRTLRLGQTERGSFIVRVLSPVPPAPAPPSARQVEIVQQRPFARAVVENAARIVDTLRNRAAEAAESPSYVREIFMRAAQEGVRPGLCDALASTDDDGVESVDVGVAWAARPGIPVPPPAIVNASPVLFDRHLLQMVRQGGQLIREETLAHHLGVQGWVTRLARDVTDFESGGSDEAGEITLLTKWGDGLRRFRLTLHTEIYREAVNAHENELLVHCRGKVERSGNQFYLRNVSDFRVLRGTGGNQELPLDDD